MYYDVNLSYTAIKDIFFSVCLFFLQSPVLSPPFLGNIDITYISGRKIGFIKSVRNKTLG